MKGTFHQLGFVIKEAREKKGLSQTDLALGLGMKNGQYISGVERGVAGLPLKYVRDTAYILDITIEGILEAMVDDYQADLKRGIEVSA